MKYHNNHPKQMYQFFLKSTEEGTPPSFSKFAKNIGITLEELKSFRENDVFDRAWCECSEIRRDYLIDNALTKRYDPSFVKFILASEFGVGEISDETKDIKVSIAVTDN